MVVVILRRLLLPLRSVVHRVRLARLIQKRLALLFTVLHLLVLLHEIAWPAAASAQVILAAISRQVVLRTNISSIDERQDPGKPHTGQSGERSALSVLVGVVVRKGYAAYAHVAAGVVLHIAISFHAVARTAIKNARTPPREAA